MLPFALTIFIGAFLLFQVQPLVGKFILPWFGGGPGVWTTCLLFFQSVLLGGYAYAHLSTSRLSPRRQVMLHGLLLLVSLALLPITPSDGWKSDLGGDPNLRILLLLTATIGLPYFVLSSTGPLMQQWFSQTHPGVSPYRLYALSNVGSLVALLSYPAYFEVMFSRHTQARMWSAGLAVFTILCGVCAWIVWRRSPSTAPIACDAAVADTVPSGPGEAPSAGDRCLWIVLPMVATVLLLATTNKISQEIAVVPFLWVLPLALYLLSFIVCFDHARWYHRPTFIALLVMGMAAAVQILTTGNDAPMRLQIAVHTAVLFLACMVCHGELYRLKPPPVRLTSYFLLISLGGALGGLFVAVVAPALLSDYRELQLGLWLLSYLLAVLCFRHASREIAYAAAIGAVGGIAVVPGLNTLLADGRPLRQESLTFLGDNWPWITAGAAAFILGAVDVRRLRLSPDWQPRLAVFVMALSVELGVVFVITSEDRRRDDILIATRNFYGTLKVVNYYPNDADNHCHLLRHGATTHGLQFVRGDRAIIPTTYYAARSGVGLAIDSLPQTPRRLGLVGLGTGTLAAYARPGDHLRIYEINPDVAELAREHFTYLDSCQGTVDIVMGDARLMMEREVATGNAQQFDLLALDAFSSDAIPVHLLTREAFQTYLRQIGDDGVIAVHISNRYLDLRPVVERLAAEFGLSTVCISDDGEADWWVYATTWVLVSRNQTLLAGEDIAAAADIAGNPEPGPLWTDDFASLSTILK